MKKKSLLLFIIALSLAVISSCTSVSRGLGNLTDNKFSKPRSGSKWIIPPPQLEPAYGDAKTVYISFRNVSDFTDINLKTQMISNAIAQGWKVVDNPTKAKFRLRAVLRYFGEVEPESGGLGYAQSLGSVAGAAVGATTVAVGLENSDSLTDVVASFGAGALIGTGLNNAAGVREWALIMDVLLEEYSEKEVEFAISSNNSRTNVNESNTGSRKGVFGTEYGSNVNAGSAASNTSKSASITKKSNYFPHGMRLSIWANQMNMREYEAIPEITGKLEKVITQILPN